MTIRSIWNAIASVALKEFLHLWRDKRILALIIVLPPFFTLLFGHAFEGTDLTGVPAVLIDRDKTEQSEKLAELLSKKKTFEWKKIADSGSDPDLLREKISAAVIIPSGWTESIKTGGSLPIRLVLDGTDATSADELKGRMLETIGEFQSDETVREVIIVPLLEQLPDEVMDALKKSPADTREKLKAEFNKMVKPWEPETKILFNPGLRFIDFVTPGIIGLILQLLTVTLMACTIAREREAGTLAQLIVTPLRRMEIVIGKVLPYLGISLFLIGVTIGVAHFHFGVHFRQPVMLGIICLLFLLCSLGSGLLISAFCQTQTQAIQFAVFYLLPVFPLSGAFAPIERLPAGVRLVSDVFPLTHFCEAFRMASLRNAEFSFFAGDLLFLAVGAIVTCGGAAWILSRTDA
jgi:ABC-2 type transport system permease protein